MLKINTFFYVMFLFALFVSNCCADSWSLPTKTATFSENGKYEFVVTPHDNWKPGHCKGALYEVEGKKRKEIWSRHLINDSCPVEVFVSDTGRYVLTMDEWHNVGTLPVVIYGLDGRLIYVHNIDSLGLEEDVLHIEQTVSSYWWNKNSTSFFGPDNETFIIRLHWGKTLFLLLENGDLMDGKWYRIHKDWLMPEEKWKRIHDFAEKKTKELAISNLQSKYPEQRQIGALVCGQMKITASIPRLKELLNDEAYYTTGNLTSWKRVYYVREAAKNALKAMGQEFKEDKTPDSKSNDDGKTVDEKTKSAK